LVGIAVVFATGALPEAQEVVKKTSVPARQGTSEAELNYHRLKPVG